MLSSVGPNPAPAQAAQLVRPTIERFSTIVCEEDSCQPLPSPPEDPSPGTLVPSEGNPPIHFHPEPQKPGHKHPKPGRGHGKGGKHR
jgi:hypothetical protein